MTPYKRPPSIGRPEKTKTVVVSHKNLGDALRDAGDFVDQLEHEGIVSLACALAREWDNNHRDHNEWWEVAITYNPIPIY